MSKKEFKEFCSNKEEETIQQLKKMRARYRNKIAAQRSRERQTQLIHELTRLNNIEIEKRENLKQVKEQLQIEKECLEKQVQELIEAGKAYDKGIVCARGCPLLTPICFEENHVMQLL
jgi:ATPase subunit of ABC transporter with duplicated ATPase domains